MSENYLSWAKDILGNDFDASIERGQESNKILRLEWLDSSAFLKIGKNLEQEKLRLEWLKDKASAPQIIGFKQEDEVDYLLMTSVEGTDLAHLAKLWSPEQVIENYAKAIRNFHKIDIADCPFGDKKEGDVLVHGDACLPNFIYRQDKDFSGYIDLGDMTVGDRSIDLAAAVWSLQYNLGKGYGLLLLQEYGISDADEQMVANLHAQYELS